MPRNYSLRNFKMVARNRASNQLALVDPLRQTDKCYKEPECGWRGEGSTMMSEIMLPFQKIARNLDMHAHNSYTDEFLKLIGDYKSVSPDSIKNDSHEWIQLLITNRKENFVIPTDGEAGGEYRGLSIVKFGNLVLSISLGAKGANQLQVSLLENDKLYIYPTCTLSTRHKTGQKGDLEPSYCLPFSFAEIVDTGSQTYMRSRSLNTQKQQQIEREQRNIYTTIRKALTKGVTKSELESMLARLTIAAVPTQDNLDDEPTYEVTVLHSDGKTTKETVSIWDDDVDLSGLEVASDLDDDDADLDSMADSSQDGAPAASSAPQPPTSPHDDPIEIAVKNLETELKKKRTLVPQKDIESFIKDLRGITRNPEHSPQEKLVDMKALKKNHVKVFETLDLRSKLKRLFLKLIACIKHPRNHKDRKDYREQKKSQHDSMFFRDRPVKATWKNLTDEIKPKKP